MPRFSVIIPTYNREPYIRDALESVFAQSCTDFEVIVADDGSSDGTLGILRGYGNRIKLTSTVRKGPGGARNAAAKLATGRYLSFLDSDDMWAPQTLVSVDDAIRETNAKMVWLTSYRSPRFAGWQQADGISVFVGANPFVMNGAFSGCGGWAAMERSVFERLGGFVEAMPMSEDNELLFRCWNDGPIAHITSPTLLWCRTHDNQSSAINISELRRCGDILFSRWRDGHYGACAVPVQYDRKILSTIRSCMRCHNARNIRSATEYLWMCYWGWRYGVTGAHEFMRDILRLTVYCAKGK